MRTSLNEIKAIDDHLLNNTEPADRLLFEANLILNTSLGEKVALQQRVYQTVQDYSRKQLRAEIDVVHQKLMSDPKSIMQKMLALFVKH